MASASQAPSLSPDWICSSGSTAHCCVDRYWFSEYTPFRSAVVAVAGNVSIPVEGVGTVELPVKRSPHRTGEGAHGILRLTDVLHTPTAVANIITTCQDLRMSLDFRRKKGTIVDDDGKQIAYLTVKDHEFLSLRLSGPPVGPRLGPSKLKPDAEYVLGVAWPDSASPLDSAEKWWLGKHFGGEFEFLLMYGLRIYEDEDREEGRAIVRASMKADAGYSTPQSRRYPADCNFVAE